MYIQMYICILCAQAARRRPGVGPQVCGEPTVGLQRNACVCVCVRVYVCIMYIIHTYIYICIFITGLWGADGGASCSTCQALAERDRWFVTEAPICIPQTQPLLL